MSKNSCPIQKIQVEELLDSAETSEHVFWDKDLTISYKLPSGFTVLGKAFCATVEDFKLDIGRAVAREDAISQLWDLEVYRYKAEGVSN